MNEVVKSLVERRSIRSYKKEQVSEEQLRDIVLAGEYAPSGMGAQSAVMVVVQDPEVIRLLSRLNAEAMNQSDTDPFYGAPTVIAVLADSTVPTYLYDGALVVGNLMNAAHAVGVDSCWIHRARETFAGAEGKTLLRKWGLSDDYVGVGNCILGYRNCGYPPASPRKANYVVRV
jgi:nitroreductase